MSFVTIKIRAVSKGEAFWEYDATVSEGDSINLNVDKAMGTLVAERDAMHAFITNCAAKAGATVDGDKLSNAAKKLLAGLVAPAVDVEGGAS